MNHKSQDAKNRGHRLPGIRLKTQKSKRPLYLIHQNQNHETKGGKVERLFTLKNYSAL